MIDRNLLETRHVSDAIDEYQKKGRDQFLKDNGFGKSTHYFIRQGGEHFDAKAIFAAAFKFSKLGRTLRGDEFRGHNDWMNQRLTDLGFEIVGNAKKITGSSKVDAASAPPAGNPKPSRAVTEQLEFVRDQKVVLWVLNQASGKCEACYADAPFEAGNGEPYLEVHHVVFLSDGGADTVANTVALCPNCHREAHYGKNPEGFRKVLQKQINRLT